MPDWTREVAFWAAVLLFGVLGSLTFKILATKAPDSDAGRAIQSLAPSS